MRVSIPVFAFFLAVSTTLFSQSQPNVIMISTDDLNTWVNPLGYEQVITPNLDRLAEMGVSFTNAHAPAAYCAPSRSAIWSGLHAHSTGCYNDELYFVDMPQLVSMQTAFDQAGYKTYGAGKLYHHRAGSFDTRGWDSYFARSQEIIDWGFEMGYRGSDVPWPDPYPYSPVYTDPRSNRYLEPGETMSYGGFIEYGPISIEEAEQIPDAVRTNWVVDLLNQEHTDPFFIGLGLYTPHFPNYAPQEFFDMYNRDSIEVPYIYEEDLDDLPDHIRNRMTNRLNIQANLEMLDAVEDAVLAYLACVSFADAMLGRVLDALEASAYKDNTIILFWSDQGYHHGEKGQWGKHTLWQETSHVPFIIAGPGIPANETVSTTVSLIDIYPTLIDLCNLQDQHQMDGESLKPTIEDPASAADRNVLISYMERGGYAMINQDWRYIQYHDGSEELYDLKGDPNEWYNLAQDPANAGIKEQMNATGPDEFIKEATPRSALNLIIENGSFYWEPKEKSKLAASLLGSITFTNPIAQKGISFTEETHPDSLDFTEQSMTASMDCRLIPQGKKCYFHVDPFYFNSNDNSLTFEISYLDNSTSPFSFFYHTRNSNQSEIIIERFNSGDWLKKTIRVADARLDDTPDNPGDFSISGEVSIQSVLLKKPAPALAVVDFGEEITETDMSFLVRTDPSKETYTEKVTKGGTTCRYIPWEEKRKYGYFNVNDALIAPSDSSISIEITYYDSDSKPLSIEYNAKSDQYRDAEFSKSGSNSWITRVVPILDAAFNNLQNNQSDFRIRGEAYVKRVAVRLGIEMYEAPEIPVEYIIPQETIDTSTNNLNNSIEQMVKISYLEGELSVWVPELLINSQIEIYSAAGNRIYHSEMDQNAKTISIPNPSAIFIVTLRAKDHFISKRIVAI